MNTECPHCKNPLIVPDFPVPGQQTYCPRCGTPYDTEANLVTDPSETHELEPDPYVVDWQL